MAPLSTPSKRRREGVAGAEETPLKGKFPRSEEKAKGPRDEDGEPCLCEPATAEWRDPADAAKRDAVETRLRQFDLEVRFGPCMGISRLQRWERAQRLGKEPPADVKALLVKHGEKYYKSVWEGRT